MGQSTSVAAGTIPWRISGRTLEVLLVHRPRYDDWTWPKGKIDNDETLPECAARETEEETGIAVTLGQPLIPVRYKLVDGRAKIVHYWAAQALPEDSPARGARPAVERASTGEVDGTEWVEARAAMKRLTYKRDREPLGQVIDQWEDDRLRTWTLVVVRHGRAQKRSAWKKGKGAEHDRPLTPYGGTQAERLVPILSAYGVEDVMTSPWERCAATVRPYLEATGIGAEMRPELTEHAHEKNPKPVRKLISTCVRTNDVPVAVCTHRPTLPTVVDAIGEHTPNRIFAKLPGSDPWLKPGEILVVHVAPRRRRTCVVVAFERVRPH